MVYLKKGEKQASYISIKTSSSSLFIFLLMAFLGGILLNFMPCVLPVLFLKFYHVISIDRKKLLPSALSYSLGLVLSFCAFALVIYGLKASGSILGWGFQMQSPPFVAFLALFFTLMGLSFFQFFHIPKKFSASGHFISGVLAVVSAAPCTVPFMGAAVGYAFSKPLFEMILIFTSLGLGMAVPYIGLCFFPAWIHKLPGPGRWSVRLKQFMAFPLFATSAWLIYVLAHLNIHWLLPALLALVGCALAFWAKHKKITPAILVLSAVLMFSPTFKDHSPPLWQDFSPETLDQSLRTDQPVLLYFTAQWCLTCHALDQTVFQNKKVLEFLKQHKVILLRGDWTSKNKDISEMLTSFGRAGVPFTLFFPKNRNKGGRVLPEVFNSQFLIDKINSSLYENDSAEDN